MGSQPEGDRHQRWQAVTRQLGYEPESIIQTARRLGMDAQSGVTTAAGQIAERLAQVSDLLTATQSVFERLSARSSTGSKSMTISFALSGIPQHWNKSWPGKASLRPGFAVLYANGAP